MTLFDSRAAAFEQATIELYGNCKTVCFLCLDLIWKPVGEKIRFVLVMDGTERFILRCYYDLSVKIRVLFLFATRRHKGV